MVDQTPTFEVHVTSTTTIFPSSPSGPPTTIPLSIADNTVAKFARCAAIWYFDAPSSASSALTPSHLQTSLSKTLDLYPHFSGRVSWSNPSSTTIGYSNRYHRIHVTYNTPADLGIPFLAAVSPKPLSSFFPSSTDRKTLQKIWDTSCLPSHELIPPNPLALSRENLSQNTPHMIIQHTTFSCGSTALSISITHSLSDAQTLSNFTNDWSSISRSLLSNSPLPTLKPVFNPRLLDENAAGDINAEKPDEEIQKEARELNMLRYDWYTPVPNQPWPSQQPKDFPTNSELSPSIPIPWEQWDVSKPAQRRILHFSQEDIQRIYDTACKDGNREGIKISKHDALLAHLWLRINIARQHPPEKETNMNVSIGLRSRLSLPSKFVGSPIMLANTTAPSSTSISDLAIKINQTTKKFTSEDIQKVLYDEAFEIDPQRLWRGCLGKEHLMVTSWVRSGVGEVDFGGGRLGRVEPVMLPFDGLCVVTEGIGEEKEHWAGNGVDVYLSLEEGSMGRLIGDVGLWGL